MNDLLLTRLHLEGLISDASFNKVKQRRANRLISVHWEIRTILYLGVMLFTGGCGILVYKNIDTIGHQFVLLFIGLVTVASYVYCIRTKFPFAVGKVAAPNPYFDYVLLLGCLAMVILLGYLQYQYLVFGTHFGLATFISFILLFFRRITSTILPY